jgi:hypothetical protein
VLRNVDELFALRQKEPPRAFPSGALRSERCGAQTPGGSTETYSLFGGGDNYRPPMRVLNPSRAFQQVRGLERLLCGRVFHAGARRCGL